MIKLLGKILIIIAEIYQEFKEITRFLVPHNALMQMLVRHAIFKIAAYL
jgi:hypothetical protein